MHWQHPLFAQDAFADAIRPSIAEAPSEISWLKPVSELIKISRIFLTAALFFWTFSTIVLFLLIC